MGEAGPRMCSGRARYPRAWRAIQLFYSADLQPIGAGHLPCSRYPTCGTTNGRRYIDGSSGQVVQRISGYGNCHVLDAMMRQAEKVLLCQPAHLRKPANIESCRSRHEAGGGSIRAFLTSAGRRRPRPGIKLDPQDAVNAGAKPSRWKVLGRNPGYHGATLGAAAVTGRSGFRGPVRPRHARHCLRYRPPHLPGFPDNHDADSLPATAPGHLIEAIRGRGPERFTGPSCMELGGWPGDRRAGAPGPLLSRVQGNL